MNCNLKNLIQDANNCNSNYAGTGDRAYFFKKSDLTTKPTSDDFKEGTNEYESTAFPYSDLNGKLYAIDIKSGSGQVTGEDAEGVDGYSNVGTFVVDKNLDAAAAVLRTTKMIDVVWFIPDGKGKFYVLYSPYKKVQQTSPFDSGTTYDSDHGHTVTLTVAPCEFNECKWAPDSAHADLDTWLAGSESGSGSGSGE